MWLKSVLVRNWKYGTLSIYIEIQKNALKDTENEILKISSFRSQVHIQLVAKVVTVALEAQKFMLGQDLTEEEEILEVRDIFHMNLNRNMFCVFFTIIG